MLLIDSDFFIGLYFKQDAHHKTCIRIVERLDEELMLSTDVLDEVMTKLTYFGQKQLARDFFHYATNESYFHLIFPNYVLIERAFSIFSLQKKRISFTDSMNIAIAKEFSIDTIVSFDRIYELNGLKLVFKKNTQTVPS